ncbi:MAG TPA: bifunctional hydroxymethylpyrimidine kinase/phosphomethylpyrimidine kinase [candidate division Zixibacteria bacterium]|nr:bifunctional hydroxymethylpyrimidine kinase/phosphomethylpyrimidine kinase [candidate division Zixibacteria bacterium]
MIFTAMTIAGSDSGAGAGIQADLKTFAALGVYGTSVITAITAQNSLRVTRVAPLDPALVAAQIDAVAGDIGAHAVKTGMLANAAIVEAVSRKIRRHRLINVVVDPVMIAKGGRRLLTRDALETLRSRLLPLATVVTPNVPEAEALAGMRLRRDSEIREAAEKIASLGPRAVVIKGGHRRGAAVDLLYEGGRFHEFAAPRIRTRHTHGTGCTFSAAIAAYLAKGETIERAVAGAKSFITRAIRGAFPVGAGHGPVHQFYAFWPGRAPEPMRRAKRS